MENKQPNYSKSKAGHPTLLGTLCFTLFNLILLSMLSWGFLEVWFSVRIILSNSANSSDYIQKILSNNLMMITHYDSQYMDRILNILHCMQNLTHSILPDYIDRNIIKIFFGVTEITVTRGYLFIKFIPFMVVILCILMIDGLVLRDKRKFQGARESTFFFHRLKSLAKASFFSLFFVYMAIPYSVSPGLFLVLMLLLSSSVMMLSIKNFKKYL